METIVFCFVVVVGTIDIYLRLFYRHSIFIVTEIKANREISKTNS